MIGDGVGIRRGRGVNAVEPRVFAHGMARRRHSDEDGDLEHLDADFVGSGGYYGGVSGRYGGLDIGRWCRRTEEAGSIDNFVDTVRKCGMAGFRWCGRLRNGGVRCIGQDGNSVVVESSSSGTLTVAIFAFDKDRLGAEWHDRIPFFATWDEPSICYLWFCAETLSF